MTATYVRIQDRKYGTDGLFDPERLSFGMSMSDESARRGVSCCDDLESLMDYYVQAPVLIGDDPVIVVMEGELSDDEPLDAQLGERLIFPTRIVEVIDAETAGFFDGVNERLGW
ncbi:hypothetical protein GCM10009785_26540 [Brooklawnia cerclae]|uniref:Uncharacterized protein n=1 Tax=Brooklawnia cerclae TaxID=349934 RepID=A0ABX0SHA1_9ACTN|nr:hypothetical protein [Brooklawnia cerclae]NIH57340.1 hypothetical protein [Brooklawnia cerclae]